MTNERVQILLTASQRAALARRAKQTGRSISDLVREYVQKGLESRDQRLDALEAIAAHRGQMLEARDGKPILLDPVEVLRDVREERSNEDQRD